MFRQGSGINEASATAQLFQCASQSLGCSLLKSDAEIVSKPLQELLSAMRRLAIIPVATGVLRSDLMQMRQLRDMNPFAYLQMARNAVPRPRSHLCQSFSACMTQTTEHVVMQPHAGNPTIHLLGQNSRAVRSTSDFISSTKNGLVIGIPNLIPCVLNATGHRNTEDATSLHHLNQAYKLLKSRRVRTLS